MTPAKDSAKEEALGHKTTLTRSGRKVKHPTHLSPSEMSQQQTSVNNTSRNINDAADKHVARTSGKRSTVPSEPTADATNLPHSSKTRRTNNAITAAETQHDFSNSEEAGVTRSGRKLKLPSKLMDYENELLSSPRKGSIGKNARGSHVAQVARTPRSSKKSIVEITPQLSKDSEQRPSNLAKRAKSVGGNDKINLIPPENSASTENAEHSKIQNRRARSAVVPPKIKLADTEVNMARMDEHNDASTPVETSKPKKQQTARKTIVEENAMRMEIPVSTPEGVPLSRSGRTLKPKKMFGEDVGKTPTKQITKTHDSDRGTLPESKISSKTPTKQAKKRELLNIKDETSEPETQEKHSPQTAFITLRNVDDHHHPKQTKVIEKLLEDATSPSIVTAKSPVTRNTPHIQTHKRGTCSDDSVCANPNAEYSRSTPKRSRRTIEVKVISDNSNQTTKAMDSSKEKKKNPSGKTTRPSRTLKLVAKDQHVTGADIVSENFTLQPEGIDVVEDIVTEIFVGNESCHKISSESVKKEDPPKVKKTPPFGEKSSILSSSSSHSPQRLSNLAKRTKSVVANDEIFPIPPEHSASTENAEHSKIQNRRARSAVVPPKIKLADTEVNMARMDEHNDASTPVETSKPKKQQTARKTIVEENAMRMEIPVSTPEGVPLSRSGRKLKPKKMFGEDVGKTPTKQITKTHDSDHGTLAESKISSKTPTKQAKKRQLLNIKDETSEPETQEKQSKALPSLSSGSVSPELLKDNTTVEKRQEQQDNTAQEKLSVENCGLVGQAANAQFDSPRTGFTTHRNVDDHHHPKQTELIEKLLEDATSPSIVTAKSPTLKLVGKDQQTTEPDTVSENFILQPETITVRDRSIPIQETSGKFSNDITTELRYEDLKRSSVFPTLITQDSKEQELVVDESNKLIQSYIYIDGIEYLEQEIENITELVETVPPSHTIHETTDELHRIKTNFNEIPKIVISETPATPVHSVNPQLNDTFSPIKTSLPCELLAGIPQIPEIHQATTQDVTGRSQATMQSLESIKNGNPKSRECSLDETPEIIEIMDSPASIAFSKHMQASGSGSSTPVALNAMLHQTRLTNYDQRKRSLSTSAADAKKRNVTFHSPANSTAMLDDIDKRLKQKGMQTVGKTGAIEAVVPKPIPRKRSLSEHKGTKYEEGAKPSKISKLPNFKNIHANYFNRMESIGDFMKRKEKRAQVIMTAASPGSKLLSQDSAPSSTLVKAHHSKESKQPTQQKVYIFKSGSHGKDKIGEGTSNVASSSVPSANFSSAERLFNRNKVTKNMMGRDQKQTNNRQMQYKSVKMPTKQNTKTANTNSHGATSSVPTSTATTVRPVDRLRQKQSQMLKGVRFNRRFELQMKHRDNLQQH